MRELQLKVDLVMQVPVSQLWFTIHNILYLILSFDQDPQFICCLKQAVLFAVEKKAMIFIAHCAEYVCIFLADTEQILGIKGCFPGSSTHTSA